MNIPVFASHGGSDLQTVIDGCISDLAGKTIQTVGLDLIIMKK